MCVCAGTSLVRQQTNWADPGWFFCFGFFLCPFCFSYRYDRLSCVGRLSVSPELAAFTCWNVYAFMNQVSRTTNRKRKTPTASPAARSSLSLLLLSAASASASCNWYRPMYDRTGCVGCGSRSVRFAVLEFLFMPEIEIQPTRPQFFQSVLLIRPYYGSMINRL